MEVVAFVQDSRIRPSFANLHGQLRHGHPRWRDEIDRIAAKVATVRRGAIASAAHVGLILLVAITGRNLNPRDGAADIGMYAQTLMLALAANGMGSCAQGALGHYSNVVKRELGVDEGLACTFGLSFGYPDEDHPSTKAITDRAPLGDLVHFHG